MKDEGGGMKGSHEKPLRHRDEASSFPRYFPVSVSRFPFFISFHTLFILHPSSFVLS